MSWKWQGHRDKNEGAIVDALEAIGVEVYRVNGKALPDLLTYARGAWLPIEVKNPDGFNRFSRAQQDARVQQKWPIVRSVAEALALFGVKEAGRL